MKIAFLATNKKGIGSLKVQIEIAKGLRKLHNEWEFLFITDLDFTDWFYRYDFRFVRIPDEKEKVNDASEIIKETIKAYSPEMMFFNDLYPSKIILFCIENAISNYLVLDEYSQLKRHKGFERIFYLSHAHIDEFESVGYIAEESQNAEIEKKYRTEGKFNILITLGAGNSDYAENIAELAVNSCLKIKSKKINIILIPGPLFKNYGHLVQKGIIMQRYEPDIISLMLKMNLIISHSGLSTITETQMLKKKSIIFSFGKEKEILREKGLYVIDDFSEEKITSVIARAVKDYEFPGTPEFEINSDEAIMLINHNLMQKELFQEINLDSKTLTSVLSELEVKNKRVILNFSSFSWFDLLLVLEFLTKKNVKEFYLKLNEDIPMPIIKKLMHYPVIYVYEVESASSLKIGYIKKLKNNNLPVVCLANKEIQEEIISYYSDLNIFLEQTISRKTFLKDILEKDLEALQKSLYKIEKRKGELLLKNNLEIKHNILELKKNRLYSLEKNQSLSNFETNKEIDLLEYEKEKLLADKKISQKFSSLNKDWERAQKETDDIINSKIKDIETKKMSLEHEVYLLIKENDLLQIKQDKDNKIEEIKKEIETRWNQLMRAIAKIKKEISEMEKDQSIMKYKELLDSIKYLHEKQRSIWMQYNELEAQKSARINKFLSLDFEEIQKIRKLEESKKELVQKFNLILNDKFTPIRIEYAVAEARNAPMEEILRLQVEKESIWQEYLAPLEKQIDVITATINGLEVNQEVAEIIRDHVKVITDIDNKMLEIVNEVNNISINIDKIQDDISRIKKKKEMEAYSELHKKHDLLEESKEKVSEEVKQKEQKISELEKDFEKMLEQKGILLKYNLMKKRISALREEITTALLGIRQKQEYLYFLRQEKAYLLEKSGIAKKIYGIDMKLSKLYPKTWNEDLHKERKHAQYVIIRLLRQKKIYNQWKSLEKQEFILRSKIDFLNSYSET